MNLWQSIRGMLLLEITSAEPEKFLQIVNAHGVALFQIELQDALTIRCHILRSDYRILSSLCKKHGNTIKIIARFGLYWNIGRLTKRPVLLIGLALITMLILFIPTRVFFISVEEIYGFQTVRFWRLQKIAVSGLVHPAELYEVKK